MAPITNTHVHVPPNFSAFATPAAVIEAAAREGVRAIGFSNFYDQSVYAVMRDLAQAAGILPLYGLEFITFVPELEADGIRVNDPVNPGRMYLTGKGIDPFRTLSAAGQATAAKIRDGNDQRARAMVARLAAHFARSGFETGLDAPAIAEAVAARAGVPRAWVSLQERHIARAFQEAVWALRPAERRRVLARAYDRESAVADGDAVGLQAELRTRLLKAGTPGFAPEVPLDFAEAYAYVLDAGGIPCYPILADGANPVCEFEASPEKLAEEMLARHIYAAELIPNRNHASVVDRYVSTLRGAGFIVMAGTEHNTAEAIPLEPVAADGKLSPSARQDFFEGACVVAAHAARVARGRVGFVAPDGTPRRTARQLAHLINEGGALIAGGAQPELPE